MSDPDPTRPERRGPDLITVLVAVGLVIATGAMSCAVALLGVLGAMVLLGLSAGRPRGRMAIECLLLALLGGGLVLPSLAQMRSQASHSNCKNNLKQLGLGLILYRDASGSYPDGKGAGLLVALYRAGTTSSSPDLFVCPAVDGGDSRNQRGCFISRPAPDAEDGNADGALLLRDPIGPHACSYAARDLGRFPITEATIRGAGETALASDDSEGRRVFNHGDSCVVLFLDGHVEHLSIDDPRLGGSTRVGERGLLELLSN